VIVEFLCVILCGTGCFGRAWVWRVSMRGSLFLVLFRAGSCTACIELEPSAPRSARLSFFCLLVDFSCVILYRMGYFGSCCGRGMSRCWVAVLLVLFTCSACTECESRAPCSVRKSKRHMLVEFAFVFLCGEGCFGRAWVWRVLNAMHKFLVLFLCSYCPVCIELESSTPRYARVSFLYVFVDFVCVISCRAGYFGSCWHVAGRLPNGVAFLLLFRAATSSAFIYII
jgi:hypothetical protein